jgi:hypothetical protein
VASGVAVTLTGSGADLNTPPRPLTYVWTQIGGTPVTLTNANTAVASFSAPALAFGDPSSTLEFRLKVDNAVLSSTSTTTVVVNAPLAPPSPSASFNTVGLVAAFGFGEGAGAAVTDASGLGNHGTIAGATWTTSGRYGSALSFDGVSDWITINDSPSLHLSTAMTLEAWAKPESLTGWRTLLFKERPGVGLSWALYASDSTAPPATYAATPGNDWSHVTGSSLLPLNTWAHVVGTYDGTTVKQYVNGLLVSSTALSGAMPFANGALRIGGNSSGQFFKGVIDEIRVYNRALTQAEIQQNMQASLLPTVTATSPAAGASSLPVTTAVTATFSEPMAAGTVNSSSMVLLTPSSTPVPSTVTYNAATRTATLTPIAALTNLTTYTVSIKAGPAGVTDATGDSLAADHTWTFTTVAAQAPFTISAVQAAPATTSAVITWTTSAASTSRVDYGTSAGALSLNTQNAAMVTAHSMTLSGLTAGTTYFFRVTSVNAASISATSPGSANAPSSFSTTSTPGLVAAYSFNEGAGTTLSDASGAGNHGAVNGATWTTAGKFGGALTFDGVSDWVTISDAASLHLTTGMTLEAWVKPTTSLSGWRTILYKEHPAGLSWSLYASDSAAPPAVYAATPSNPWSHITGSSLLTLNEWTHVAGTYDGTTLRLYVNGVLVRSGTVGGPMPVSNAVLRIGGHSGSGQFFKGAIDEIRIYNRALTAAEVRADMAAPYR